jgi:hypothetical protein
MQRWVLARRGACWQLSTNVSWADTQAERKREQPRIWALRGQLCYNPFMSGTMATLATPRRFVC